MRVAYLGPAGTNSEVAALRVYPDGELVAFASIPAIARAVAAGETERGVAPVENSLQGTITDTVDALIRDDGLAICGEIVLPIEHCLMVKPGTPRESIDVVYSHPQSLGQCRRFLETTLPAARTEAAIDVAAGVAQRAREVGFPGIYLISSFNRYDVIAGVIQRSRTVPVTS